MKSFLLPFFLFTNSLLSAQDPGTLLFKADSLYSAKNYKEAIPVYTSAIKVGATKGETTYQIGNCYFFMGLDTLAQRSYNEAELSGYKGEELYFMRGQSKTYMKNNAGAIEDYSKAIAINPNYLLALKKRAYLYQLSTQYTKAVADFDVILKSEQSSFLFYSRAYNLQMNTMYDKAIADYKQAIKLDSSNSDLYLNCGNCYILMRNFNEGINYYNFAIQKNPLNAIAYYSRGLAFQSNGKNILACEDLSKARELGNPNASQYLKNCGANPAPGTFLYCMRKASELSDEQFDQKISLCNKALEIYKVHHDSNDSMNLEYVYLNRATFYYEHKDYVNAEKDFDFLLKNYPNDDKVYFGLGSSFLQKGENKKAIENFDKAIELAKTKFVPSHYYGNRALAKYATGDQTGACADYKLSTVGGAPPGNVLETLCK